MLRTTALLRTSIVPVCQSSLPRYATKKKRICGCSNDQWSGSRSSRRHVNQPTGQFADKSSQSLLTRSV